MTSKTYRQVHGGLLWFRGRASEYVCSCGKTAKEWAYRHTGFGWELKSDTGAAYSEDVWNDYVPLCRTCHTDLDREVHSANGRRLGEEFKKRFREDPEFEARIRASRRVAGKKSLSIVRARILAEPEFRAYILNIQREKGRKASTLRRKCSGCDRAMAAGPLGSHQKHTGHVGWSTL